MSRYFVISGIGKRNKLLSLFRHECSIRDIKLLGLDASLVPPAKYQLECFSQVPLASDNLFIAEYNRLASNSLGCLTIVDPEIVPLSLAAEIGGLGDSIFLHPSYHACKTCEDKLAFFEFANYNGIRAIPSSVKPDFAYPMVVKDRAGSCSSGFAVIPDSVALADIVANKSCSPGIIYQPFCDGIHYCIDAYFSLNSHQLVDLCVKLVENKQRGESYVLTTVKADRFIDLLNDLAAIFVFSGIVNFDIYDWMGALHVMEVNCRIGGNYPVSHLVGVNLIAKMLDELTSSADYSNGFCLSNYQSGLTCVKYFDFSIVS